MKDGQVAELLEGFTRPYDERAGDWDAVRRDALPRRPRRWPLRAGLVLAAAVAVAVGALAWPFGAQQPGLFEQALAAIGEGPVLHVVVRRERGATLIDLSTGSRRRVHGEGEVWYDADRGLVRAVSRLGSAVEYAGVSEAKEPPAEFVALALDYRQALQSGTARVAGDGTIDGEPVAWITIRTWTGLDRGEGREHEWARQVAVSRRTFRPLALGQRRDDDPSPRIDMRILQLELLPAGAGGFTTSAPDQPAERFRLDRAPIRLEQARAMLGRTPLWLGEEHAGLPLARAFRKTISRQRGPTTWNAEATALELFYGTLGDDATTPRQDLVPRLDRPHLTVTQSTRLSRFRGVTTRSYVLPEGSVLIEDGALSGIAQVDGLQFFIEASSAKAVLAAARALEPMPK